MAGDLLSTRQAIERGAVAASQWYLGAVESSNYPCPNQKNERGRRGAASQSRGARNVERGENMSLLRRLAEKLRRTLPISD